MGKPVLALNHVSKHFGAVQALKDVSFSVDAGEIHTLLGENGAGKSTIIKIISGEYTPDSGTLEIGGEVIQAFDPNLSRSKGISVVHQELTIFENMTVYENMFPYAPSEKSRLIPKKQVIEKAQEMIERFGLSINPMDKMSDLRLSSQQMVEILRALSENARIVLLDEPTSGLNTQETEHLMGILRKLRDDGVTIIYISHRISEILQISDRISIMRDGEYVDTLVNDAGLTENTLISKMVGRDFSTNIYSKRVSSLSPDCPEIFAVRHFTAGDVVKDVSFSVRRGEVFGVFGLEGSGTHELSRMLFGLHTKDSGEMEFEGQKITAVTPENLIKHHMIYLNNNRKDAGLFFELSVADNMALPVLDELCPGLILDYRRIEEHTKTYIKQFNIVLDSPYSRPDSLSGGNQQKVMLSVCLGTNPKLVIINEPTRGIDINAKMEILDFIIEIAKQDVTVICFSSDLPELITLSDRIMVMYSNQVSGILTSNEINEENVMKLAALGAGKGGERNDK